MQAINLSLQSASFIFFSSGLVKITGSENLKSRLLHFLQFWSIISIIFFSGKLSQTHGQAGQLGDLGGERNGGKREPKDLHSHSPHRWAKSHHNHPCSVLCSFPLYPSVPSAPSQPHPCPTASSPLPTGCCWVPTREEQPLSSATCLGMWTGTVTPRVCVLAQREIVPAKHQVPGQPCMGQEPANKACVKTQGV